jgi:hypothetical protein
VLLGRKAEDVYPTYYRANSPLELEALIATTDLKLEACVLLNSSPQMVRVPPLMALELAWMRLLRRPRFARFRACMLSTLVKPQAARAV